MGNENHPWRRDMNNKVTCSRCDTQMPRKLVNFRAGKFTCKDEKRCAERMNKE